MFKQIIIGQLIYDFAKILHKRRLEYVLYKIEQNDIDNGHFNLVHGFDEIIKNYFNPKF